MKINYFSIIIKIIFIKILKKFFKTDYGKLVGFILIILGTFTLYFRFIGPIPFSVSQTTTEKKNTFDVQAEGKVTAIPDTAEINLGIQVNKPTVEAAQKEANEKINKTTSELKKLGIEEKYIKTVNYNVYPDYNYQIGQKIVGYNVNITLTCKIKDFEKINKAIDIATAQGANQIGNLNFVIDDEKLEDLKMEARKQAIEKAKNKAREIASAGGIKIGRIVNITESSDNFYPIPLRTAAVGMGGEIADKQTAIQPGESEITVSIILSYETL